MRSNVRALRFKSHMAQTYIRENFSKLIKMMRLSASTLYTMPQ